jgi:glucose-6-phosphate 1-epimerase
MNSDSLQRYLLPGHLSLQEGAGGLPVFGVDNALGSATIQLQGAHLTAWQPRGHEPVIFTSSKAIYQSGKAIRGGIPVCWPWFADHETDPEKPAHGFVRSRCWNVKETRLNPDDSMTLTFALTDNSVFRTIWPHAFALELRITVGAELEIELRYHNTSCDPVTITAALHTYFNVGHINNVKVSGLNGASYIDKVDMNKTKTQCGDITISKETDRIYQNTTADCVIEDPLLKRKIRISKSGSNSTVVWNPWREKAAQLKDLADNEYESFICIETANAGNDRITLEPDRRHSLIAVISMEPLKPAN